LPITLHSIAAGARVEMLALKMPAGNNAGLATLCEKSADFVGAVHNVSVQPVADVLAREQVSDVALLKIDVEGFEE
jgi:FkbM family methyltransferase